MVRAACTVCLVWCCVVLSAVGAWAVSLDPAVYRFTTSTYESIADPPSTALRYDASLNLELSILLDAPLGANLSQVPLDPLGVAYDDGVFARGFFGGARERFTGWVSTDAGGAITAYRFELAQQSTVAPALLLLDDGTLRGYGTSLAQQIVTGYIDACYRRLPCGPQPVYGWVSDRGWGTGLVTTFVEPASDDLRMMATPVPAPLVLLLGALVGLGLVRRRSARLQ